MPLKLTAAVALATASVSANALDISDFQFGAEVRGHYRVSDSNRFATQFPFPPEALPEGETSAFVETVDAGEHVELSMIALFARWNISEDWLAQVRIEGIDKYERNPTSTDHTVSVDTAFIRYGQRIPALRLAERNTFYAQVGKFAKMERQVARRTESYGLVSTAFNRFEDTGLEAGFDLQSGWYGKFSHTVGNPVFMRDPNVLAGDNGTNPTPPPNHNPELKSGIVILYDAEVEGLDISEAPETGAALGYRWNSKDQNQRFSAMAFTNKRQLTTDNSLHGTFYGTDIDLFDLGEVPSAGGIRLPYEGDNKTETGLNIWYEYGNFAAFGQWVEQDMANLGRSGQEVELSYVFQSTFFFDEPIHITPVIRYSQIDHDFVGTPNYPAPSVWWDWQKVDYALNVDVTSNWRVTLEYTDNQFERAGKTENNNETLLSVRWLFD